MFSLIPMLTRNIIPHDMIENLYWGKELQLGYEKHPPLFAWISYFFYKLFGSWPESLYILTQLNLLLGFYFIYKTSRLMLNKEESYASVLIFMTSVCAVFGNEKFNASTILMSLFPAMFYFFVRILKFEKKPDAVFLGIFSAAAFIGKYFALLYIGCMGLFLLQNKECRKFFKMPHFYIAAVVFMICISWHVIWIIDNDCVTLKYALAKTADCPSNRFYAFNFLIMQFIFFATSFWALAYACRKDFIFFPQSDHSPEEKFIIFITIVPNVLLFFVSLITGMRIGSFWGTNMMMTLGIYLVLLNKKIDINRLFCFTKRISTFFAAVLFLKLEAAHLPIINDPTYALNIREISKKADEDWNKKFGNQKMKILKTDKATAALHIHLKDSPSSYDTNRLGLFQVFDLYPPNENAVAVFLSRKNGEEVARFRKLYNGCILFENTVPVTDDYFVYYAFVNTKDIDAEKKL
jgi:4-amino-4-deoxy-L-arabinose transferase-like glycosyltransferase